MHKPNETRIIPEFRKRPQNERFDLLHSKYEILFLFLSHTPLMWHFNTRRRCMHNYKVHGQERLITQNSERLDCDAEHLRRSTVAEERAATAISSVRATIKSSIGVCLVGSNHPRGIGGKTLPSGCIADLPSAGGSVFLCRDNLSKLGGRSEGTGF